MTGRPNGFALLDVLLALLVLSLLMMISLPFASPGTRFVASELKAAYRPSTEIEPPQLAPLAVVHPMPTLTRVVRRSVRSRT